MVFSIFRGSLPATRMPSRYLATYRSRDVRVSRSDFHTTPSREILKPYLLADIGEGEL